MNSRRRHKEWGNAPIADRLSHFDRTSAARKYVLGGTPCGNCNSYKHTQCRPRLDGQACSCECERATRIREELDAECISAESKNQPMTLTPMDIAKRERDRARLSHKITW